MATDLATAIAVDGVSKTFASRRGDIEALRAVNLRVASGEIVCLVGPSGCGKSTLLRILAGLVTPSAGRVSFHGTASGNGGERPRLAMVFQEHGLYPWLSLIDNVAFGLEAAGVAARERHLRAGELLDQLGIGAFGDRYPDELSGGMCQRAAIARALLTDPHVLLMDEPFSAIDAQSKLVLQEELMRLWGERRQTVVYVTHDIQEAVLLGDRVYVMTGRPGTISQEVPVTLARPRDIHDRDHPEVKAKVWSIWSAIEGQVRRNLHIPG